MGALVEQKPAKLIASIIYREDAFLKFAEKKLGRVYGCFEPAAKITPFSYTDYYRAEFGEPLKRKLVAFKKNISPENVSTVKLRTNRIEALTTRGGKRRVNIDPGYVTEAKLVLLTTKDYKHRVYLGRHIFAESTLFFQDGSFRPWPWTYPDYASEELITYFNGIRDTYIKDIRSRRARKITRAPLNLTRAHDRV